MAVIFSFFLIFGFLSLESSEATDTLLPNQTIIDNGENLVSLGQNFELGFFSPWNSSNRYVGIWFKNISPQTVVWVANRNSPLTDSSGSLSIAATGNIFIVGNQSTIPIWSSNSSTPNNFVLQLLDTGNLVVKDAESSSFFWQSFDHPCDTIIPGMKFGWNLLTNQSWFLTSWKSLEDPSIGEYNHKLEIQGLPQFVIRRGSDIVYRSGPWDGNRFGLLQVEEKTVTNSFFIVNSTFVYYSFEDKGDRISRYVLNQSGSSQLLTWNAWRGEWIAIFTLQRDQCDEYGFCGPYGLCNVNMEPHCRCLSGFDPKIPRDWNTFDWFGGCIPRTPLNCSKDNGYGFKKFSMLKLPDNSRLWSNRTDMTQTDCNQACLRNCSCVAYAITDVCRCVMWFGSLLDMREYNKGGNDLYVKMDASELGSESKARWGTLIITVPAVLGVLLLGSISYYLITGYKRRKVKRENDPDQDVQPTMGEEEVDLPSFDLVAIATATNDFSVENKVGEGGFGHVYKGVLPTGKEIAVKRLAKDSGQGLQELKNEVIFIAKLQHRNLVRLLGCCIHQDEKMLVYEYMPNRSLDLYLFNQTCGVSLDWQKRFDIIVGIARGLLYLHRDSRLRIIHRDLKASNILLDSEMNPRISDFGLARMFRGDQSEASTKRVVGTYGYMPPEYAIDGLFSVKSDVFSFGVLVLEIISGKRNRGFYHPDHDLNLIGHASNLWNEDQALQLVDVLIEKSIVKSEVLRCIQVGLLCVQERSEDRPSMSSVLLMLDSEQLPLPQPKQPGFYTGRITNESNSSSIRGQTQSRNEVTITMLQGR
ncbi:hypothetical protein SLEP1_g29485 [Rubroshorea leprosula]|uniref:Receptor-like serine/threonine-protein kinase n=1 Tax=Rubroshorea leprosula TaxID=152421 RepID=A0AAV5K8I5_9ROSI|nr:hypothetical protein SLEP1_g29485 [Rubroshorea leprosula]